MSNIDVERSSDGGKTWDKFTLNPRSLVALRIPPPGHTYDDGAGNMYRAAAPTSEDRCPSCRKPWHVHDCAFQRSVDTQVSPN